MFGMVLDRFERGNDVEGPTFKWNGIAAPHDETNLRISVELSRMLDRDRIEIDAGHRGCRSRKQGSAVTLAGRNVQHGLSHYEFKGKGISVQMLVFDLPFFGWNVSLAG